MLGRSLLEAIDWGTSGGLSDDDVTVLVLRPNGTGMKTSLKDRLLAPLRVLKGVGGSLIGKGPAGLPELSLVNIGGAMFGSLNRFWRRRITAKPPNNP